MYLYTSFRPEDGCRRSISPPATEIAMAFLDELVWITLAQQTMP